MKSTIQKLIAIYMAGCSSTLVTSTNQYEIFHLRERFIARTIKTIFAEGRNASKRTLSYLSLFFASPLFHTRYEKSERSRNRIKYKEKNDCAVCIVQSK